MLGAVAVFCVLFGFIMLIQVERDPERHRPAWQDEDADEEKKIITYRSGRRIRGVEDKSTPWRHDPSDDEEEFQEEEEEDRSATGKFSPAERDDPEGSKEEMLRKVHKVLNILLGILFAVALALLIFDIYLHSL